MSYSIQKKFVNKTYFARNVHLYTECIMTWQIYGVKNQISLSITSQTFKIAKKRDKVHKNILISKAYFARKPSLFYVKRYVVSKFLLVYTYGMSLFMSPTTFSSHITPWEQFLCSWSAPHQPTNNLMPTRIQV